MARVANTKFTAAVRKAWPDRADQILAIIRGNRAHALTYPSAQRRDDQSYHPHDTYMLKLEALSDVLGGFGAEGVPEGRGRRSPAFDYVNMGDAYHATILYIVDRAVWRVGTWGDVVERGRYA